jgi:predicted TIM-barrel fold metal-dependent hydrolase
VICDVDTRLWASPTQLGDALVGVLRRLSDTKLLPADGNEEAHAVQAKAVDRAFLLGFRSKALKADLSNDFLAAAARRRPDKLVAIAGIDPILQSWRDDLDRAVELGCLGVSVSPSLQGYPPTHSQAMRLWERCATLGLPVFVSRPLPMPGPLPSEAILEADRPLHWDEVLRAFPGLTVVLASLGQPWVDETLVLVGKHERCFTHLGGCVRRPLDLYRWLTAALDLGVADRILFASGFPFETPAKAIEKLYGLAAVVHGTTLQSIPRREIQAIVERDAFRVLGVRDRAGELQLGASAGEQAALLAAARSLLSDR